MSILALDPGTKTGATITDGTAFKTFLWDVKARPGTKKRKADPKYFRLVHLWNELVLSHYNASVTGCGTITLIVCEGAQGFIRGKNAVEASHKYRAVIELFGALYGIEVVMVSPNDLKEFALGKRSGSKDEMIDAANRMGYEGHEDNEADSFMLAQWAVENRPDAVTGRGE